MIVSEILHEAVVVDIDEADKYVGSFARRVRNDLAKRWFTKTLRAYILNNESLLRQIQPPQLAKRPLPDYARKAAEEGKPVYTFRRTDQSVEHLTTRMNHVVDWFTAMQEVIESTPSNEVERQDKRLTEKILSKVSRLTPETILGHADRWFNHMGTRLTGEKGGVELIKRWPSGYYGVRYTEKETMMRDGRDMQNCLQRGYYWKEVETGRGRIFGIRKPTDEAVVSIRLTGKKTIEVKGKNNDPVTSQYAKYAVDLLNEIGAEGNTTDTETASIYYHGGRYAFGFDAAAETVYDKDGIQVKRAGDRLVVIYRDEFISLKARHGTLIEIDEQGLSQLRTPVVVEVLDAIGLPPSSSVADDLEDIGVFYSDRYGDIGTVRGRKWPLDEETQLYHLSGARFYVADALDNAILAKFAVKKGHLEEMFSRVSADIKHKAVEVILDKSRVKVRSLDSSIDGFYEIQGQVLSTVEDFIEFYRDNATVDVNYDEGIALRGFLRYHGDRPQDDKIINKLVRVLTSKKPSVVKTGEHSIYGLTVPQYRIWVPVLASNAMIVIDDEAKKQKVKDHIDNIVNSYADHITKNAVADYQVAPEGWQALVGLTDKSFRKFEQALYDARRAVVRATERAEAEQGGQLDLSSRFASLNALRKLGKK